MGDMGDIFRAWNEHEKERKARNLSAADPTGWKQHTTHHWSRFLDGDRLDYWPSRNKWQYRCRVMTGDVKAFIAKREGR